MRKFLIFLISFIFTSSAFAIKDSDIIEIQSHKVNIPVSVTFEGNKIDVYGATNIEGKLFITITGGRVPYVLNEKIRKGLFWVNKKTDRKITIPSFHIIATQEKVSDEKLKELGLDFDQFKPDGFDNLLWLIIMRLKRLQGTYLISENTVERKDDNLLFKTTFDLPNNVEIGNYEIRAYILKTDNVLTRAENQILSIKRTGMIDTIYKTARDHPYLYAYFVILLSLFIGYVSGYTRR